VVRTEADLLVVTAAGFGKRTPIAAFQPQGRGGQGVRGIRITSARGGVVAALMAGDDDEILVVNSGGVVIRTAVREVSRQGRDATGVRIMNLSGDDVVAAVAPVIAGDEEAEQAVVEGSTDDDGPAPDAPSTDGTADG
jgi:DNA gyrase subunit A